VPVPKRPATLGVPLLVATLLRAGDYKSADGSVRRLFTGTSADMAVALSSLGMGHVARAGSAVRRPSRSIVT
jgi:hypothetical protein